MQEKSAEEVMFNICNPGVEYVQNHDEDDYESPDEIQEPSTPIQTIKPTPPVRSGAKKTAKTLVDYLKKGRPAPKKQLPREQAIRVQPPKKRQKKGTGQQSSMHDVAAIDQIVKEFDVGTPRSFF